MKIKNIYFPHITQHELVNIKKVIKNNKFADGCFQHKCNFFLKEKLKSKYIKVTQSCSDALEISTYLLGIKPNDEVLLPSFTFSATANAIIARGAKPVFVDSREEDMCICFEDLEKKITKKTKCLILVHYGNNICDIDKALYLKKKHKIKIIEDAAHSIFAKYRGKYVGTFGDIGTFSFHETKNFCAGQGGAISINDKNLIKKAELVLDKGNDLKNLIKSNFNYFNWVEFGSEYQLSELPSALLYGQLKRCGEIVKKRKKIFDYYSRIIRSSKSQSLRLIDINRNTQSNYHICPIIFSSMNLSLKFMKFMKSSGIYTATHYYPLHMSKYGKKISRVKLKNTEQNFNKIVRLPIHSLLTDRQIRYIGSKLKKFINNYS